ncbi:MAG: ATP-binding protein [Desulfurococcales archaeon]|nr:ATP-binding protein [Desulfurococcales archaeon]
MGRVKLGFAGLEVDFVDRERALEQVRELGEKGTFPVYVIYGPEGCGKSALLRQASEILEGDLGYYVLYVNPLAERLEEVLGFTPSMGDVVREVFSLLPEPYSRIVDAAVSVAYRVLKRFPRPRLAVLMDDIFQAVGLDKAEAYVKTLLNLIEHPPAGYEKIVVLVTSSEGVTRERVGRHNWADIFVLWNMQREGFKELYNILPGSKPSFEDVMRWVGGNPRYLEKLFKSGWRVEKVVNSLVEDRGLPELILSLSSAERRVLEEAVEDPDVLLERYEEAEDLVLKLVEKNLVLRVKGRDLDAWIDTPPPEKDLELGIGRHYAWQTPLHREAVKRAIDQLTGRVKGGEN